MGRCRPGTEQIWVRQVGDIDRQVGVDVGKLIAVGSGLKIGRFSRH
jgi:hypothetical protein